MCGQKSVFLEPQGHLAGFTRAINLGTVEERSGLVKLFQPWWGRQRCAMVVWAGKVHASTIDSAIKLVASYVNVQAFGLLGQPFVATVVIWNKVGRCVISRYPPLHRVLKWILRGHFKPPLNATIEIVFEVIDAYDLWANIFDTDIAPK